MMDGESREDDLRLLIFAPLGKDGDLLAGVARSAGIEAFVCPTMDDLCTEFQKGAGGAVITEEALHPKSVAMLEKCVADQPRWSDVSFIVLCSRLNLEKRAHATVTLMSPLRNVVLIERPARPVTLVKAFESVLRDRQRQWEVRQALIDLHASQDELKALNSELEQRVSDRTIRLQEAVNRLEGFTYSIAHDLRSPVRAMLARTRIIREDFAPDLNPGINEELDKIHAAAAKLGNLVEGLLSYARLGHDGVQCATLDLGSLAKEVLETIEEDIELGVEMEVQAMEPIQGDLTMMQLLLYNVFQNSVKYRSPNRPLKIQVGENWRKDVRVFFIRDNGIGFDNQYASKLFQPFHRLHRDSEYPGAGIGLANVRRIIELQGGEVWAEGQPGVGATISFTLDCTTHFSPPPEEGGQILI